MNLAATVLHNVTHGDRFWRYNPETSRLVHAHTFQIVADNADQAAELIWMLTNVDDANHLASMRSDLSRYGPQVTAYRSRRNRSLSVGDVVVFHEVTGDVQRLAGVRAVAGVGWETLEAAPDYTAGSNETVVSQSYAALLAEREDVAGESDGADNEQWETTTPPEVYATDDDGWDPLGDAKR